MQDQVRQLRELDVPAACLNHMVPIQEYVGITTASAAAHIRILYLAPETLLRPETLLLLDQSQLACLAMDEAHCISEWGHDFRPEYRQLHDVRRRFPQAVCLALTATATARVREDIRRLLGSPPKANSSPASIGQTCFSLSNRATTVWPRCSPSWKRAAVSPALSTAARASRPTSSAQL